MRIVRAGRAPPQPPRGSRTPCETCEAPIKTKLNDVANTRETILLVDDEAYIRELVGAILRVEGYRVLEASDGEPALEAARGHAGTLHLLLTDVVMSPMGGGELVRRLLPFRPEMKVLFMSGYPDDPSIQSALEAGRIAFLAKPFSPKELLRNIRQVLDAAPAKA